MSRYDANTANTNREVSFRVEANVTGGASANADAGLFGMLKGNAAAYPHYGQATTAPTANDDLAQLRTSLIVRALTRYNILVGLRMADDAAGTGRSQTASSALILTFESDEQGEYFNQPWTGDTTLDKHMVGDITDALGTGGMTVIKTKPGLSSLLASLATVSYDGGVTGPFGTLSATGNIVMPDGRTTAAAPVLDDAAGVADNASGLEITYLG